MRNFTLVMGIFNLEVEESKEGYSAKCKKVGFNVEKHSSIDSLLFPFCAYLAKKQLTYKRDPSKLIYRGFTLEIEYMVHTYTGVCKEIGFEEEHYIDDLTIAFLDKVDKHLEKNMNITHKGYELIVSKFNHALFNGECKELEYFVGATTLSFLMEDFPKFVDKKIINQFSVVYNDFTLEVWQEKEKTTNEILWHGKCEAINFEKSGYHYLDTLVVSYFQEAVNEYSKPTKIEYKGYELEIVKDGIWFIGTSKIFPQGSVKWHFKDAIEKAFREKVDEKDLLANIRNLERLVSLHQEELEEYLKSKGYKFDTLRFPWSSQVSFLYAIHPDYWDRWSSGYKDFPEDKVIFIKQQ